MSVSFFHFLAVATFIVHNGKVAEFLLGCSNEILIIWIGVRFLDKMVIQGYQQVFLVHVPYLRQSRDIISPEVWLPFAHHPVMHLQRICGVCQILSGNLKDYNLIFVGAGIQDKRWKQPCKRSFLKVTDNSIQTVKRHRKHTAQRRSVRSLCRTVSMPLQSWVVKMAKP